MWDRQSDQLTNKPTELPTLPLLLSDYEKQFKKGDNLIFASFGGGFTWGATYLKWAYNS